MATLENRAGNYRIVARVQGQKLSRSLKTKSEESARASLARLEDNLHRIELGTLVVPEGVDLLTFLLSDGRLNIQPERNSIRTLEQLFGEYLAGIPQGSLEATTLRGMQIHIGHLQRLLGRKLALRHLDVAKLQQYVDQRSKAKGLRGRKVSGATIKKELVTLNTAWNWALSRGFVSNPLPKKEVKLPKTSEKPRFHTWTEIERKVSQRRLSDAEERDLWDCLFLSLEEIDDLLIAVKTQARHPFLHPMFTFAAHTGARRSEMVRSLVDDVDLVGRTVTIREKKRVRGKLTTRSVPMSPTLHDVLKQWLSKHPGGQHTFCLGLNVERSKARRTDIGPLTPDEAHDHFKRTLAGTKWEKLRGWHVFRHSFCSNCAARGLDQRMIDAWVGHQTQEMVKRYRHLFPNQEKAAIRSVFGDGQQPLIVDPT